MLVLTRCINERVMIGEDITVEILSVKGNQVRLGFTAPADITIHREEIKKRIEQGVPMRKPCTIYYKKRAKGYLTTVNQPLLH